MTTIVDVLTIQKKDNVIFPPAIATLRTAVVAEDSSGALLTVNLYNSTTSNNPTNPSSNGFALQANCSIALGAPGTTRRVTAPQIAGGRVWFCVENTLTFLLNPSETGQVSSSHPSATPSDPNYYLSWDFREFTYNSAQLYANITYVDFVCLPIALTLTTTTGSTYHVGGLPSDGLTTICNKLIAQNNADSAGWVQLVITKKGSNLRALSPSNGIVCNSSLFENYWTDYINQVWKNYISNPLKIDTQSSLGCGIV